MCSDAWGAEIHKRGKVVWFEPATQIKASADLEGDVYDFSSVPQLGDGQDELADGIDIRLEATPVALYAEFLRRYHELRRELRILSLAHKHDYPVAETITDQFERFDAEFAITRGVDQLAAAIETGIARLDVKLTVPSSSPATMQQMLELLELADAFCRAERLLALATTPEQLRFQRWFLGEFVWQSGGRAPQPWQGSEPSPPPSPRISSPNAR
jgi:hypothetical protein